MEIPKTQTINLSEAQRFCLGLQMLAKECNMASIDYSKLGVQMFHFADGSYVGGLRAYIDSGLIIIEN